MTNTISRQPNGHIIELFSLECVAIIVMDYDDQTKLRFLRLGELIINLTVQFGSNIVMTFCNVNDLQWPITKDSPILRVGKRSFLFMMPGLLYGFQLAPVVVEETVDSLERVFMRFADYTNLIHCLRGARGWRGMTPYYLPAEYPCADNDPRFWTKVRPHIERIGQSKSMALGYNFGNSASAVNNEHSGVVKSIRVSATTKLVVNAILTGLLKPMHIQIFNNNPMEDQEESYPSITIITKIVEAIETIWLAWSGHAEILRLPSLNTPVNPLPFKCWKLSEEGLSFFLRQPSVMGNMYESIDGNNQG